MKRMSSVNKCDSAVMFGFIISLVLIFRRVIVSTTAQACYQSQWLLTNALCSDMGELKYPFWYDGNEYYSYNFVSGYQFGYPGFGIKCVEDKRITVMNISNHLYRVTNVSYTKKVLTVKELDIDGQECPHPRRNFSLQEFGSSLKTEGYTWTLFYNCSNTPHNDTDFENYYIGCLGNSSGRRSYAFPASYGAIPEGFNWYENCEESLVVPATAASEYSFFSNFTADAAIGFELFWSAPSADCNDCEYSGGNCCYNRKGGFHRCVCESDFTREFDKTCFPLEKGIKLYWLAPSADCKDCEYSGGLCTYYINGGFCNCSCGPEFSNELLDKTCPRKKEPSVGVSPSNLSMGVSPSKQPIFKSNHRERGLSTEVKVLIGFFTGGGVLLLLVLLIYRRILFSIYRVFASQWRNNIKGLPTNVEMFLESCGHLTVQRYKYSDIKKMTNSFKETLGEGGYGSVFKGKLKNDGRLVAVKLLNEAKGNGEDFINEVTTIGRTNHVNVVSLLGFCTEGTKRALVYEFMPNGSLEKFIYNEKRSTTPLGWEKLYEIALGIARGLEYLHRGCNTRILHFDIKPHNILLDQDFCPKISDFGLAKLCPTREGVVSMLVARGTIGYIAPEVYCRNFGGVSHKSDVYSYGMMVLEIVGGRKNIDATVENISEIYFPQWIYNHLKQGVNLEGSKEIFEDETTRKMILVALWCIQRQPADRPSISKVVEMLEGRMEEMQMPPNPFEDFPSSSS